MSDHQRGVAQHLEYSELEERLNIATHLAGVALSVVGTVLLIIRAFTEGDLTHQVSFPIFGVSLIVLYTASTLYHWSTSPLARRRLKVFDHAAIYLLIAGSYTPFTIAVLDGWVGWLLFGIIWSMAAVGICLKLFYTGRFKLLSTALYLVMGWMIVFAIGPLIDTLKGDGVFWLTAGGVAYSIGAILYSIKRIPFNHAIFHLFVVLGSTCQFFTVYSFII